MGCQGDISCALKEGGFHGHHFQVCYHWWWILYQVILASPLPLANTVQETSLMFAYFIFLMIITGHTLVAHVAT